MEMALRSRWFAGKEEVAAENGVVVSKDPRAAEVGLEILKQGGNAVDAAVATGFAISVVEPMMSSVAGVGFMLIHLADQGKNVVIEYPPRAPKAASPDMYKIVGGGSNIGIYDVEGDENADGYRSITVPGTVAGLCLAHKLFGKLPLQQVMEPAIALAEEGSEVNWYLALSIGDSMDIFQRFPGSAAVFLPHGRPPKYSPKPAERLFQKDLAQVIRLISKHGPDGFYKGDVAAAIEEDMKAKGGLITRDDLASYEAVARDPARISYRGYDVLTADVHFGATTLLQSLNVLGNFDLAPLGHNSPEYLHLFIEAARHAFADRYYHLGDQDFVEVPMKGILSDEYARHLAGMIDSRHARLEISEETEPWVHYETKAVHDPWAYEGRPKPAAAYAPSVASDGDCTTHFGVVDRDRNLVSCTQTAVSIFGSKVVSPGLGILWNNGMRWFNPKPGSANSIAPWKRPLTNMAPILVLKDGKPYLSIGAPGGRRIINCNTQVFLNVVEFGMGIQEAIGQPRVDASAREAMADARLDAAALDALVAMGHNIAVVEESPADINFATPLGILVDHENGRVHGGVDVFRIAEARGY
jgi:gamma-glutamyltranspeptidase/glutathione hydrolase